MARPIAIGVFTLLTVAFLSCSHTSLSNSAFDDFGQTEHYTAWPRDNDTILTEDFPWTSCNKVTGENCPGVMDVIRHICRRFRGNLDSCTERYFAMRNLSNKRVVLNLRPGMHRVELRQVNVETFFTLSSYWSCNFSTLTIQGSKGNDMETEVMALADSFEANRKKGATWLRRCPLPSVNNIRQASWTVFAFYGEVKLIFKDLTFRSKPETASRILSVSFISTLNVRSIEIIRCRFNVESAAGAVSIIYTANIANITVKLQACEFNMHFCSNGIDTQIREHKFSPPLLFGILEKPSMSSSWPPSSSAHGKGNVTLNNCKFWSNYTIFGNLFSASE